MDIQTKVMVYVKQYHKQHVRLMEVRMLYELQFNDILHRITVRRHVLLQLQHVKVMENGIKLFMQIVKTKK